MLFYHITNEHNQLKRNHKLTKNNKQIDLNIVHMDNLLLSATAKDYPFHNIHCVFLVFPCIFPVGTILSDFPGFLFLSVFARKIESDSLFLCLCVPCYYL